jgi:hypothetical protein
MSIMKNRLLLTLVLSLIFIGDMLAQIPSLPTDDGDVQDVPIHILIYPLLALGAYLGFKALKKN